VSNGTGLPDRIDEIVPPGTTINRLRSYQAAGAGGSATGGLVPSAKLG
jgi:hypothetical protein